MSDTLSSRDIKKGNVLALLNTLYTSGFASVSPNQPILNGRTMHTLYALSFLIYVSNCLCDWVHIVFTVRGTVVTFPLYTGLIILMVTTVVGGSMLTALLLVLCVENAFAARLDVTPYRSGFAIIAEAVWEWVQAFNNFRVAFLVMLFYDTPMTIINYFYISSCRCAGPTVFSWSLVASSFSTTISLLWRFVMLYFSYRRMMCQSSKQRKDSASGVTRFPSPLEHLRQLTSAKDGGRLDEYDECWPVRFSRVKIYGGEGPSNGPNITRPPKPQKQESTHSFFLPFHRRPSVLKTHFADIIIFYVRKVIIVVVKTVKMILFCAITLFLYLSYFVTLCLPCCYHYSCRANSFYHRHKCSRSCVRYMSYAYHYFIFFYSLLSTTILIVLNIILMSSVHGMGSNEVPPEIGRLCITLDSDAKTIVASVVPKQLWGGDPPNMLCKPLWDNSRQAPGPWQMRTIISPSQMLAVSTDVQISQPSYNESESSLVLFHDHAILELTPDDHFLCHRGNASGWSFHADTTPLPWPYFRGCVQNWDYRIKRLIDCDDEYKTTISMLTLPPVTVPVNMRGLQRRHRHEKIAKSSKMKFV